MTCGRMRGIYTHLIFVPVYLVVVLTPQILACRKSHIVVASGIPNSSVVRIALGTCGVVQGIELVASPL